MIAAHFVRFSLKEKISDLVELVGNADSELVIRPLPMEGLHIDFDLASDLSPLYSEID